MGMFQVRVKLANPAEKRLKPILGIIGGYLASRPAEEG